MWYELGERYVPVLHRAFQWHLQVVYDAGLNEYTASEIDTKQREDYIKSGFPMKVKTSENPVVSNVIGEKLLQVWESDFKDTPTHDRIIDNLSAKDRENIAQVESRLAKLPVIEFPLASEKQSLPESDSEVELLSARTLSAAESFEDALEDPVETLQGAIGGLSLAEDTKELQGFRPPPRNPFEQTPEDRQLVGPSSPPNLPQLRRTRSRKDQGNRRPLTPEGTSQKTMLD